MRVTIRQIAQASGLSIQTVSQILNGNHEAFRPETRDRVLKAAQELGYRRNSSARAMRTGSFGSICLLMGDVPANSMLPSKLLGGIMEATSDRELALHVARLPDEILRSEESLPKVLRELAVDGVVVKYDTGYPPEMDELLTRLQLPSVWVNSKHAQNCVYPDDLGSCHRLTEDLIRMGHRKIAYLDWLGGGHYSSTERRQGYEDAMRDAGLDLVYPEVTEPGGESEEWERAFEWVADRDYCTAVITYHTGMARATYIAARALGRSVPREISIATFYEPSDESFMPVLGGMELPMRNIGEAAVEMLTGLMQGTGAIAEPLAIPSVFHLGGTIRPLG